MATAIASTQEENPRKTPDQQRPHSGPSTTNNVDSSVQPQPQPSAADVDSSRKEGDESKASVTGAAVGLKEGDGAQQDEPVTDIQKKIRRAERFGMPVQLSEEEKRHSRAERFGTGSAIPGSTDGTKKSEEQKRKARAERFGIMQSVPADEEAKKKARLARFGAAPKTDSLEEEKKKARAIRFSQPPSGSLSQVSGTASTIKMKTAVVGKASGGT